MPLLRSAIKNKSLVECFSQHPCDCRIICKDGYVEAHAVILSTASVYLRDLLSNSGIMGSPRNPAIIVMDFDRKTVLSVKKLIYEGETKMDVDVARCIAQLQLTCG